MGGSRVLRNGSAHRHSIIPSLVSATLIQDESSNETGIGERSLGKIVGEEDVQSMKRVEVRKVRRDSRSTEYIVTSPLKQPPNNGSAHFQSVKLNQMGIVRNLPKATLSWSNPWIKQ